MIRRILAITFLLSTISYFSKANFDFNNNCKQAFQALFDLRLNDGRRMIANEKRTNPGNGIAILLDNYADYFALMASENKTDFEHFKELKSTRLDALEKMDKQSPYYLFAQAAINLQVGMMKSKFQEYFSSGMDIKRAKSLLNANAKKFPGFLPNKMNAGLVDVIFGSIPPNLKGIFSALGISGNAAGGIKTLEGLMTSMANSEYAFFRDEVVLSLCYIETELVHNRANYNRIIGYTNILDNTSLLKAYLRGYLAARSGQNDQAIDFLLKAPKGDAYLDFPAINYVLGNAKLQRGDNDAAVYLQRYVDAYRGINFVKDAYLKMAYHFLLRGDAAKYQSFIKLVLSKGQTINEKDKQAFKEAKDDVPDLDLLKARLYFDGGYYNKALVQLNNKSLKDFKVVRDHIEIYYRLGRLYDEIAKDSLAVVNYQKSIQIGRESSYYFAANAALFLGLMYEKNNDYNKAAEYFNQAINMKNHEYEKSIESKAKMGLKRIGR